jgi:cobalamin synthase
MSETIKDNISLFYPVNGINLWKKFTMRWCQICTIIVFQVIYHQTKNTVKNLSKCEELYVKLHKAQDFTATALMNSVFWANYVNFGNSAACITPGMCFRNLCNWATVMKYCITWCDPHMLGATGDVAGQTFFSVLISLCLSYGFPMHFSIRNLHNQSVTG